MKVLVVEDGAVDRLVLETLLRQRGHEVTHVADAESAWEVIRRERFPLMFTDLRLPGLDGLDLLSKVDELPELMRPHCVVITASQKTEDLQRALDRGAHDYMLKASGAGALGVRIAIAEQHALLRERQAHSAALQSLLYRISEAAHSAENLEALYESLRKLLSERVETRNFYVALKDTDSGVVSFPYWRDERGRAPEPRVGGDGLTEYVLRTGEPLLVDPELREELYARGEVSAKTDVPPDYWLGVPLRSKGTCFGVIGIFSYSGGFRIGQEEQNLLGFVSEQVAVAIERKRTEAALRRHERMAAMGELVAGVAHEIRNPLFGLSAMLDALEQKLERQGTQETRYLGHLREQIRRMTGLVEDLLVYGRPYEPSLHPIDMADVVREAVSISTPLAENGEISLEVHLGDPVGRVSADRKRLVQALVNLIDNALQHSERGSVVEVHAVADPALRRSRCAVKDQGPGFGDQDLAMVFEPFFTRRRGGTGLGLAIAQRIVEEHHGTIVARNGDEGGAIVEVALPLMMVAARDPVA